MNREQMIAWLLIEGVSLNKAPIIGDKEGRYVWAARDGEDELQRYMDKPDTWERYSNYDIYEDRVPVPMEQLTPKELRELYKEVRAHREP